MFDSSKVKKHPNLYDTAKEKVTETPETVDVEQFCALKARAYGLQFNDDKN